MAERIVARFWAKVAKPTVELAHKYGITQSQVSKIVLLQSRTA